MDIHTHTHTYILVHTHTYILIHTHAYSYTHIHAYSYIHTYIHIFVHTHIHTYSYIHTYIHTHIHTIPLDSTTGISQRHLNFTCPKLNSWFLPTLHPHPSYRSSPSLHHFYLVNSGTKPGSYP